MTAQNIHATAIVLAGRGILLRGPSGSGKSLLALLMLEHFGARGQEAVLVADDRVDIRRQDDAVLMSVPEPLAGLIELRGRGILERPHRAAALLHLIVDLVPALVRMPEEHDFRTELLGLCLPRCPVPVAGVIGIEHQRLLIEEALGAISIPVGG